MYIKIYYSECPPGLSPDRVYYFPWAALSKTMVYDYPGLMRGYYCVASFADPVPIEHDMSVGFQIDNYWGTNDPHCYIVVTNDYEWYGDCDGYWDGSYWGYGRRPLFHLFGDAPVMWHTPWETASQPLFSKAHGARLSLFTGS